VLFFIGQILPYIATAVFLVGASWRAVTWLKVPVPFELTVPAEGSKQNRLLTFVGETIFFDGLRRGDKRLWLWAWLLHISLIFIIIGHIAGIYYTAEQFTLIGLSAEASSRLSAALGTFFGIVLFASLIALLYRRTAIPVVKRLSDPADFFVLGLLLAIVITGMHMRVTSHEVDLPAVRAYLGGLFTLQPVPIPKDWIFVSHFTLVNILLIYFPFSKLIHMIGGLVNQMIITQPPPVHPTPSGFKRSVSFGKEAAGHED
jgi:nitrate reductase gamma subunit